MTKAKTHVYGRLAAILLDEPHAESHRANEKEDIQGKPEWHHMGHLARARHIEVKDQAHYRQRKNSREQSHDDIREFIQVSLAHLVL